MANPLTLLELKPHGFQLIQELPIDAPPKKAWAALLNFAGWFGFDPDRSKWPKVTFEPRIGGRFITRSRDGTVSSLHGIITHVERGKLLRLSGQMGMSHLPVQHAMIWELQPQADGKKTLLRFGQRSFGFLDAEVEQRMRQGWGKLLPQIKQLAEGAARPRRKKN